MICIINPAFYYQPENKRLAAEQLRATICIICDAPAK